MRAALSRVRAGLTLALQAGVGAALAWFVAHDLIGRPAPFFAPISAVITLASSVGQRARRTTELVIGVALGIGIGDLIIHVIGTGPWQIGLVVILAILVATGVGGGTPLVTQSASSAVLVATLTSSTGQPWSRFLDALVGGGIGLTVMTVLLPLNPLTVVRRSADPALAALADGLHEISSAMTVRDGDRITAALAELRAAENTFTNFAPARWHTRGALAQYVLGAPHMTYALRNVRVMSRRVKTALDDDEAVPDSLPAAIGLLGDAVGLLKQEWAKGAEPLATRERALSAAREAMRGYDGGVGFSGGVVVAQVRTTVTDLLRATGVESSEAVRMVRKAVGRQVHPRTLRRRAAKRP